MLTERYKNCSYRLQVGKHIPAVSFALNPTKTKNGFKENKENLIWKLGFSLAAYRFARKSFVFFVFEWISSW